tara:strand:+ start:489 stop:761 length:273 start_codon:yes stop_codon:yes gene_type:complete
MSKPSPQQLAAAIDPLIREYIDAHMRKMTAKLTHTTEQLDASLARTLATSKALESDMARSVRNLNKTIADDPTFKITRAKLITIAKELNL